MARFKWKNLLLYIYFLFLFVFVVFKFDGNVNHILSEIKKIDINRKFGNWNYNIQPFSTMKMALREGFYYAFRDVITNIVLFIPCGFLFTTIKSSISKVIVFCIIVIFVVELLQFVFRVGYFDVDDIMMNTVGSLIGCFISKLFFTFFHQFRNYKKQHFHMK